MTRNLCVTNAFRRRVAPLDATCARSTARELQPDNIWSLVACIVAKSKRRASASLSRPDEKKNGRLSRLVVARDVLLSTIPIERFYRGERQNATGRLDSRALDFARDLPPSTSTCTYTCDTPSVINIYLSNSRTQTPSGAIIVMILPMVLVCTVCSSLHTAAMTFVRNSSFIRHSFLLIDHRSCLCLLRNAHGASFSLIPETTDRNFFFNARICI